MPGSVVHVGSSVICAHAGQCTPSAPFPRVLVGAQPVTTIASPWVVAGCAMPPPPGGNGPCVTGQWLTGSTRVLAGGVPLVLQVSTSTCAPTATPMSVVACQPRVVAT